MAEADTEPQDVDAPLVFQCRKCHTIVGDTFSWVTSDQELNTVTLSSATTAVSISSVFETSAQEKDLGSTYTAFACSCGERIGRIYKTTARHLDPIRDLMTFDLDAITSYKLGSTGILSPEDELDYPSSLAMQADINKIQQMLLVMNDRLQAIEPHAENNKRPASPNTRKTKKTRN